MIRFILAFKNNIGGGSASGSVTIPSTDIIVSGFSDERFNGRYSMQDTSATGIYRVWAKDDIRIQTDMDTDGNMALWRFVNDEWNNEDNPSIAHSHMPYENPWDTEEWFVYTDYHGISGTPVVTLVSVGSDIGGDAATSTDIIVSGHINPDVNGTYKLVDESATGYDRRWVKDGNPLFQIYSCYSLAGHDWVLDFNGDFVCASGFEIGIDNPVDIQTWVDPNGWGTPPKFEWGEATLTLAMAQ